MVKSATSLTRSGLRDWIVQRVSAVIIGLYVIFLTSFILFHPQLNFMVWQLLFCHPLMQIFSFLTLVAIVLHAYIGMWTIATDYLTRYTWMRMLFLVLVWLALLAFLAWGAVILYRL